MKELIDTEYVRVDFDEKCHTIVAIWKKPTTKAAYQFIFNEILEHFKTCKADAFVSDISLQGLVDMESRQWLKKEILPKACRAGLRTVAVVSSRDVFSSFYISDIRQAVQQIEMGVEFNDFASMEPALDWVSLQAIPA